MTVRLRKCWILPMAFLAVTAVAAFPSPATAAIVTFTNTTVDLNGTGFGTRLTILALSDKTSEFGSVGFNGTREVTTGDATNQSNAPTVAELADFGVTAATPTFGLIFNLNEPGSDRTLVLNDFTLDFLNPNGTTKFQATYNSGVGTPLVGLDSGNGNTGFLFLVTLETPEELAFFNDPTNRLGQTILSGESITGSAGGAESFFIGPQAAAVPEVSSLVMAAIGCVGFGAMGLNRRRSRKA